jgi:hypothetical protein
MEKCWENRIFCPTHKLSQHLLSPVCIAYMEKLKLHGLSPLANYTDREARRLLTKLLSTVADRGCHAISVTNPYGRNLGFLDRSRYFLFQVAYME